MPELEREHIYVRREHKERMESKYLDCEPYTPEDSLRLGYRVQPTNPQHQYLPPIPHPHHWSSHSYQTSKRHHYPSKK